MVTVPIATPPGAGARLSPFLGPGFLVRKALEWAWKLGRTLGWASRQLEGTALGKAEPPALRAARLGIPLFGPTAAFFIGSAYLDLGELKADWLPWAGQQARERGIGEKAESLAKEGAEAAGAVLGGDPILIAKEALDFGREVLATDPDALLRGAEEVLDSLSGQVLNDPRVSIARGWVAAVGTVMSIVSGKTTDVLGEFWGWFAETEDLPSVEPPGPGVPKDPKPPKRLKARVTKARKRIRRDSAILRALKEEARRKSKKPGLGALGSLTR